jgi:hypothetical protein
VGVFVLGWLLAAFCMWVGAKLAGVAGATLGKAFLVAPGCSFVAWTRALVFPVLPLVGTVRGAIAGILLSLFVIKGGFSTSFGKAVLV